MNRKISLMLICILSASLFIVGCEKNTVDNQRSETSNSSTPTEQQKNEENTQVKEEEKTTPEESTKEETTKETTIYSYNVDSEDLIKNSVSLDTVDENSLFSQLQSLGVIPKEAKLNSFKVEDIDGVNTALIDVDSNFMNTNLGSGTEELMLNSFAHTYIDNMGVGQVKLTVDGENYQSGHIMLEDGDFLK